MFNCEMKISGIKVGHVQGIATDGEFLYYSCTTYLAKMDKSGKIVGTVGGLKGHLGCIAFNSEDKKVYGSLEYKHDSIGKNILSGVGGEVEDGFYIAVFEVDKITQLNMDAETDGIMKVVYLKEVYEDYSAPGHRFGCSGIDGITFAPAPNDKNGKKYLYVAYGIYSQTDRNDNDNQVILRYDISKWDKYKSVLKQNSMPKIGPEKPDGKYFAYTGNTKYGIQNLEYDCKLGCLFAAVYRGEKPQFPNFYMYVIDLNAPAEIKTVQGLNLKAETLSLSNYGQKDEKTGIYGVDFPLGAIGMISLGDGNFYFAKDLREEMGRGAVIEKYTFDGKNFIQVE